MPSPAQRRCGRTPLPVFVATALLLSYPCAPAAAQTVKEAAAPAAHAPAALSPELQASRAALEKYQDPVMAIHDGYFSTLACVEYLKGIEGSMRYAPGGMGVHFINLQNIGPKLDPARPQVLLYEPQGDRLRLVAAEWFVPTEVAGATRPVIFGQELQGPMEGHEPLQPKGLHHWDLHVWFWKTNPAGMFSATNPALKCPKGSYSFTEHAPKIVKASGH
jgi:hypothetical protein